MKLPREFNMHRINDYLSQRSDLTATEFRVAYYTIHSDYGRQKEGLFWEGAASIAKKLRCRRASVHGTWGKMLERGWITDTGKKVGRAKLYRIEYQSLWDEAVQWKREQYQERGLPEEVTALLPQETKVAPSGDEGCSHTDTLVRPGSPTPPNDSTQILHQKEAGIRRDRVATASDGVVRMVDLDLEEEESQPSPGKPQPLLLPEALIPFCECTETKACEQCLRDDAVPETKPEPKPRCRFCKCKSLASHLNEGLCPNCYFG